MTLDTYAHVIEELEARARASAEGVIYAARADLFPLTFPCSPSTDPSVAAKRVVCRDFVEAL